MSKNIVSELLDQILAKVPHKPLPEVSWDDLIAQSKKIEELRAKTPQLEIKGDRPTLDLWLERLRPDIKDMPSVTSVIGGIPIYEDNSVPHGLVALVDKNPETANPTVFWRVDPDA